MAAVPLRSQLRWDQDATGLWLTRVWVNTGNTEVARETFGVCAVGPSAGPALLSIDDGENPTHLLRFDTLAQAMQAGEAHVALAFEEFPPWVATIQELR